MASKRDLLSKHETLATFDGLEQQQCFFMTSFCPDECGHGGTNAVFTIIKYLNYQKTGQYGDEKSDKYYVRVTDSIESTGLIPQVREILDSLEKGEHVQLSWNHDYVHTDGCSSPERPITKLVKITKEDADKL